MAQWKFTIKLERRSIVAPFQAPVRADISHDTNIDRVGTISDCRASIAGLTCSEFR